MGRSPQTSKLDGEDTYNVGANKVSRRGGCRDSNLWRSKIWRLSLFYYPPTNPARKFNEPLPWYHFTAVMRHFLPWYHFTAVIRYFLPWHHLYTAVMRHFLSLTSFYDVMQHFLPWYHFIALMRHFLPWYHLLQWCDIFYLDMILLPWSAWCNISSYCRDATFSTLISFYCRDGKYDFTTVVTVICVSPW